MRFGLITILIYIPSLFFAQQLSYKTTKFEIKRGAEINVKNVEDKWLPVLTPLEMPEPGNDEEVLRKIKEDLRAKYPVRIGQQGSYKKAQTLHEGEEVEKPQLLRNFEGNKQNTGVPLDNDMAISNGGKLVSVTNSIIYMFDVLQDTLLKSVTLDTFGLSLGVTYHKYDPKVIYDPIEDRFILVYLNGSFSASTKITVAFSQTNDPTGNWNLYTLDGNPFLKAEWSDYPMITITKEDFFLTINLVKNSQPWQTGFAQTLIWQVTKNEGYTGQTINPVMYSDIKWDNTFIRNLCPVKGGAEILGPNMYFLSNKNLSPQSDTLFLVEISNSIGSGSAALTAKLTKSPFNYFVPPSGRQANNLFLQTNDSRVLGALIHNDEIQFVQNTMDTSTGLAAIYHGIMSDLNSTTPKVTAELISDDSLDFGYPNISYAGSNITHTGLREQEDKMIITFNHTSPSVFAGVSAVYFSDGKYSDLLTIKSGLGYIDIIPGVNERWGDYSGSQRMYNDPGKVWLSCTFGEANHRYSTWIAELGEPEGAPISASVDKALMFPNPVGQTASVNFYLDAPEMVRFSVYDEIGRLIIKLSEAGAQEGQNIFSFSTAPLRSGTYFLVVETDSQTITKEKFVKY